MSWGKISAHAPEIVAPSISQVALEGNLLTRMTRAGLPLKQVRELLSTLLYIEESNADIELKTYNQNKTELEMVQNRYGTLHYKVMVPGVAENRPSVLRGDTLMIHADTEQSGTTYYACVHFVNVDNLLLSLPHHFVLSPHTKYSLVFRLPRIQERKLHRAVVLCDERAMLFLPSAVGAGSYDSIMRLCSGRGSVSTIADLNEEQRRFIQHVHGPTRLSVLWGPPGTGKTTAVVAAIIDTILRAPKSYDPDVPEAKILVCAPSNEAADLIVERIVTNPEMKMWQPNAKQYILRVHGMSRNPKAVPEEILNVSPRVGTDGSFEFPSTESLKSYQIIVSTLMSSDRLFTVGFGTNHFTHLFVDEAGHATEQLLMIGLNAVSGPNTNGRVTNTKVVLAGDPKQLGPRITIPALSLLNVYQSPLQRIQEDTVLWPMVGSQLLKCYRSHPAIVHLINTCYNDALEPVVPPVNQYTTLWNTPLVHRYWQEHQKNSGAPAGVLTGIRNWATTVSGISRPPIPSQPIMFLAHTHPEQQEQDSPSWMNHFELITVTNLVMTLREQGLATFSDMAVITPYRKQAQRIQDKLWSTLMHHQTFYNEMISIDPITGEHLHRPRIPVKVATVDSYQGRESKIVIVSCVRSAMESAHTDPKFGIGFLNQPERTNVALSRAKDLLIIIGNRNVLCNDKTWQEYLARLDGMDPGVVLNLGGPTLRQPPPPSYNFTAGHAAMEERGGARRLDD